MKNIAILGSSGSIGESTLSVIRNFPDKFRVVALSVNSDINKLLKQIKEFSPLSVCVNDKSRLFALAKNISPRIKVFSGEDGLKALVKDKRIDQIMFAISGSVALMPLVAAIESGREIALANKEALVMAGPLIMRLAQKKKVRIIPVDSEQSAIWQCIKGEENRCVKNIYLTASGGPLRRVSRQDLKSVGLREVLRHPRWKMGKKITVDSATLMNKGLELLEAMFLFDTEVSKIKVLVHPEALIHSMVEYIDGSMLAQLGNPDMRTPIAYGLAYPERIDSGVASLDLFKVATMNFTAPDFERFPCLALAYQALRAAGTAPAMLNAANEIAVEAFLNGQIAFLDIPKLIADVLAGMNIVAVRELEDVLEADTQARVAAQQWITCR